MEQNRTLQRMTNVYPSKYLEAGRCVAARSSHWSCPWKPCLTAISPWLWATAGCQRQWCSIGSASEILNQTNECLHGKLFGQKKKKLYCVTHCSFQSHYNKWLCSREMEQSSKCTVKTGKTRKTRLERQDSLLSQTTRLVCSSLELVWPQPLKSLLSHTIVLVLSNNRMSMMVHFLDWIS